MFQAHLVAPGTPFPSPAFSHFSKDPGSLLWGVVLEIKFCISPVLIVPGKSQEIYKCTHTYKYTCTQARGLHIYMGTCTCTYTYVYTHTHTHNYACTHTYVLHTGTRTCVYIHTCILGIMGLCQYLQFQFTFLAFPHPTFTCPSFPSENPGFQKHQHTDSSAQSRITSEIVSEYLHPHLLQKQTC